MAKKKEEKAKKDKEKKKAKKKEKKGKKKKQRFFVADVNFKGNPASSAGLPFFCRPTGRKTKNPATAHAKDLQIRRTQIGPKLQRQHKKTSLDKQIRLR